MATNFENNGQASTNYKEAFSLFDKRGNGRVALDSLGDLLRACGQNPTLSEIRDLERNVGGDCEWSSVCLYVSWNGLVSPNASAQQRAPDGHFEQPGEITFIV